MAIIWIGCWKGEEVIAGPSEDSVRKWIAMEFPGALPDEIYAYPIWSVDEEALL